MKLLVATKKTQGKRGNDFCFCREGEIVKFGMKCPGEEVDGNCGCARSMVGVTSSKSTTTTRVVVSTLSPKDLKGIFRKSLVKEGWAELMKKNEVEEDCDNMVKGICEVANQYAIGDVIEKRGDSFIRRI